MDLLLEPRCFTRHCKHFLGIKQDENGEVSERVICEAYPENGIPGEIAYGDDLHIDPRDDDGGIQFERSGEDKRK